VVILHASYVSYICLPLVAGLPPTSLLEKHAAREPLVSRVTLNANQLFKHPSGIQCECLSHSFIDFSGLRFVH